MLIFHPAVSDSQCSLVQCIIPYIMFLLAIFKGPTNGFLQLTDTSHTTNILFIACQCSAGKTENTISCWMLSFMSYLAWVLPYIHLSFKMSSHVKITQIPIWQIKRPKSLLYYCHYKHSYKNAQNWCMKCCTVLLKKKAQVPIFK
jgi:hypothetical protein